MRNQQWPKQLRRKQQQGFTLIELIVALVIVATLAVVAAPRFLNFSNNAFEASIKGVEAALASSLSFADAKIAIDNADTSIDYQGQTISLTGGMPAASAGTLRALLNIEVPPSWTRNWQTVPCSEPEFCILGNMFPGKNGYVAVPDYPLTQNGGQDRASYIWPRGYVLKSNGCYAFYINEATKGVYYSGSIVEGC
ncbi:prepilin-type N-terminal cleavage/methylation domain-containing protein [Vibrio sp. B1Z05]|uniref:type II secretion system protein n=1 Tax=Vibrio sp. B1Z05 TaxID=2654980 RepID=UPI00128C3B2F|nr:prepilin-type N-terminal cleavage/methylation domain-containing protein [Vibrio sp. B1Z05]